MAAVVPSGILATASMYARVRTAVAVPSSRMPRSAGQPMLRTRGRVMASRMTAEMATRSQAEPAGVSAANWRVLKAAPVCTDNMDVTARVGAGSFMTPFDRLATIHV
jgi:hypothetical protein